MGCGPWMRVWELLLSEQGFSPLVGRSSSGEKQRVGRSREWGEAGSGEKQQFKVRRQNTSQGQPAVH